MRSRRGQDIFSNSVPEGQVVSTLPASGQPAPYGSVVEIIVSHGPIMVVVPDVRNLTFSQASDRLAAKGIQFSVKGTVRAGEVVVDQTPKPRSRVPLEGTTVELTFGPQS